MKSLYFSKSTIIDLIASLLIFLLVYTASSKILEWHSFSYVLGRSPLIKTQAVWLKWFIPLVELGIAGILFFPFSRLFGFYAASVLLAVFTAYIVYMILFEPQLPCACGGMIRILTWKQHIVFNLFFIILSCSGIYIKQFYSIKDVAASSLIP